MNKTQLILFEILLDIDSFCREHDVSYFLSNGTLIGAVRHQGFIPWDDDIDIVMKYDDYDKFTSLYKREHFEVLKAGDKGYYYPFAKVCDKRTLIQETFTKIKTNFGLYVDIFPLDYIPDDIDKRKVFFRKISRMKFIWKAKVLKSYPGNNYFNRLLFYSCKILLLPFPASYLCKKMDIFSRKQKESQHMGITIWGYGLEETMENRVFENTIELQFENKLFYAPKLFDEWLRGEYGDYMTLPPQEKRVSNHDFAILK